MINKVNAVTSRQNLGEMLNHVQHRHDSILVKKGGKPVAALIDAKLFDRILRFKDLFDSLSQRIADAYENVPQKKGDEIGDNYHADTQETNHFSQSDPIIQRRSYCNFTP